MTNIPDTVTRAELVEAMTPLLDLLGIRLVDLYGNLDINFFESNVTFTHAVPADAVEIKALKPEALSGNASSEYAAVTTVGLVGPMPKVGPTARGPLVEEGRV